MLCQLLFPSHVQLTPKFL
uniref:Uncharacterized protein n=1 Tax=Arundo donax TaxID=35708 RepID=A0A0A9HU37_ARUDO